MSRKGMLSKKQLWRRTLSSSSSKSTNQQLSMNCDRNSCFQSSSTSSSCEITASKATTSSSKIRFHDKLRVILVPARQDYFNSNLQQELWWEQSDYAHFKMEAKEELEEIMRNHNCDLKSAMNYLFSTKDAPKLPNHHSAANLIPQDGSCSPSSITRQLSMEKNATRNSTKTINFLEIHGKLSHLYNPRNHHHHNNHNNQNNQNHNYHHHHHHTPNYEKKPIHPLALLVT